MEHKVGHTLRNAGLLVRRFPQGSVNLEVTKKKTILIWRYVGSLVVRQSAEEADVRIRNLPQ